MEQCLAETPHGKHRLSEADNRITSRFVDLAGDPSVGGNSSGDNGTYPNGGGSEPTLTGK